MVHESLGFGNRLNRDITTYSNVGKRILSPDQNSIDNKSFDRSLTKEVGNRNFKSSVGPLFDSGMGVEPPRIFEVGKRLPKLGPVEDESS